MMLSILSFVVVMFAVNGSFAFVSPALQFTIPTPSTTARNLLPESSDHDAIHSASLTLSLFWKHVAPEDARGEFFFFFGAGTGAGGIGLGQVPKIVKQLGEIQALGGVGPTQGGEPFKVNPIATLFYPTPLSKSDVEKVISKIPSSEKISAEGKATSYLASQGYIDISDFMSALEKTGCNPLASYAAFDAISKGSGSIVSPVVLDEKVARYREENGLSVFANDLLAGTATKLAAYAGLAFLLFIIFDLIIESGINAFLE